MGTLKGGDCGKDFLLKYLLLKKEQLKYNKEEQQEGMKLGKR